MKLQPIRGTKDLLPEQYKLHKRVINIAEKLAGLYDFQGMSTPIIEKTNVFSRTLGDYSDVVSKEMYSFLDRSDESISLRPEFTAGVMRSFISNGLQHKLPLKFFSHGPVFRYDRPQAGRQRQFHQLNFENIGSADPFADAELLRLASDILSRLGILADCKLQINSLGCAVSRENYNQALVDYFQKYQQDLSEDSQKRLAKNPLRILDSKDKRDQEISIDAPKMKDYLQPEAAEFFAKVLAYLDVFGVPYEVNDRLVRGLDYYCHTAFEFVTDKLGAQGTVLAGGRYDKLAELMGGVPTPAVGFAAGIERLVLMSELSEPETPSVYIMPMIPEAMDLAIKSVNLLRQRDIKTVLEYSGKISKRMQLANKNSARYVIFIGEDELNSAMLKIKDMNNSQELSISFADLEKWSFSD